MFWDDPMQQWSKERFAEHFDHYLARMKGQDGCTKPALEYTAWEIRQEILNAYGEHDHLLSWHNALCELIDVARALWAGAPLPIPVDNNTCWRCLGVPNAFHRFSHINNGRCLRCNGTLVERGRPVPPAQEDDGIYAYSEPYKEVPNYEPIVVTPGQPVYNPPLCPCCDSDSCDGCCYSDPSRPASRW